MSRGAEDRQRPARTHKYQHVGRPDGERSQHLCVSGMRCDPCIALGHQPVSWTRHAQARKTRAFVVAYSSMLPLMKVEIYETLRSCMGATKTRTFRPRNKSSASFSLRMNFWYVALKYAAFHIGYIDRGGEADITMRTPQFNQGRKISSTGSFSPTPTMCHSTAKTVITGSSADIKAMQSAALQTHSTSFVPSSLGNQNDDSDCAVRRTRQKYLGSSAD